MVGPKLFQTALKRLPALVDQLLTRTSFHRDELLVIPHQASPKALELIRRRLKFSTKNFLNVAADYGNMAAAGIPFVIDSLRQDDRLEAGQPVLLLGTSAGYSQAGVIFQV